MIDDTPQLVETHVDTPSLQHLLDCIDGITKVVCINGFAEQDSSDQIATRRDQLRQVIDEVNADTR